ncbi:MAG TPA: AEC family transporter [Spirochaetia bacterium]|nr:AEC family transporter [Spirochaetia bacterium]
MFQPILLVVLRLFGLTLAGYLLFRIPIFRRRVLDPFVLLVLNVLFPLYFVHNFPAGWDAAVSVGWQWMAIFFGACFVLIGLQIVIGRYLVYHTGLFRTEHPRELISLFAIHNAGYLPLPILAVFAPRSLMVYMFFFVLAFNLVFWTVAVSYMSGHGRLIFRANVPLVGIFVGLLLAVFHLYHYAPEFVRVPIRFAGDLSMDLVLVALGGVLATIPASDLRLRREFGSLVLLKLVLYPALVLVAMAFVPLRGLSPELAFGIRLGVVLQAAVPPATNLMIVAKAYGSEEQVRYVGSGIIVTYLASLVTLPLFLFLSTVIY